MKKTIKELEDEIDIEHCDNVATVKEILEVLTRILRRTEREAVVVKLKSESVTYDEDGNRILHRDERFEITETPPKISDVNKSAELLGKYYGVYTDKTTAEINLPIIISGDDKLK